MKIDILSKNPIESWKIGAMRLGDSPIFYQQNFHDVQNGKSFEISTLIMDFRKANFGNKTWKNTTRIQIRNGAFGTDSKAFKTTSTIRLKILCSIFTVQLKCTQKYSFYEPFKCSIQMVWISFTSLMILEHLWMSHSLWVIVYESWNCGKLPVGYQKGLWGKWFSCKINER